MDDDGGGAVAMAAAVAVPLRSGSHAQGRLGAVSVVTTNVISMFDPGASAMLTEASAAELPPVRVVACPAPGLDADMVRGWRSAVTGLAHAAAAGLGPDGSTLDDGDDPTGAAGAAAADAALALISELESLTAAAAAAQAALAVQVDRGRRAQEAAAGVPAKRRGAGVAAELGLARRVSGSKGSRLLGLGKVLTTEMPYTFATLAGGDLTEWRATLLARETACLDIEDRVAVDRELCADPDTLAGKGDRAIGGAAKRAAYRRDAHSVVNRNTLAEKDRRVWVTPAPDQMAYLTALLPLTQAVGVFASLKRDADSIRATGHAADRTQGQLMADALVSRVTGLADGEPVPVRVNLVMTDATLFRGDGEPGLVPGYGPVPAHWARDQVAEGSALAEIRRLYTAPRTGDLVAMDSTSRQVPAGLAEFITLRDQGTCRIPWCDAPIRHVDHVIPVERGGVTSEWDLQGTCEAHNYAKQAPGWQMTPLTGSEPGHEVEIRAPSGEVLRSRAPNPPRGPRPATRVRPRERRAASGRDRTVESGGPSP